MLKRTSTPFNAPLHRAIMIVGWSDQRDLLTDTIRLRARAPLREAIVTALKRRTGPCA